MMMSNVLILSMPSASLVFGLDWLPLINGRANRIAYRMARQYRATHLIFAGDTAAAVGLAVLKPTRAQRRTALASAAQSMAQLFPSGTVALLLKLDLSGYWLVAVHEGAVVARTDSLFDSLGDAQAAMQGLRQSYPQLTILGSPGAPDSPGLPDIEAAITAQTRLLPLTRWRSVLPAPVQWFVLVLLMALLAPRLWSGLGTAAKPARASPPVDAALVWKQAIARTARNHVIHGTAGTRSLLQSLYRLPADVAGWRLAQASCVAQRLVWRCTARYMRRHRQASNKGFLANAPRYWSTQFTSMEHAEPVWTIDSMARLLDRGLVKTAAYNEQYLFSHWQKIKPAFTQMQSGKPAPLTVALPRDKQGKVIARPPGLARYMTRAVTIKGPLRSSSLLLPHLTSIGWKKISILLRDNTPASLKKSQLTVSFEGVLYETETAQSDLEEVPDENETAQPRHDAGQGRRQHD